MESAYAAVQLWKATVEKAKSFAVPDIQKAAGGVSINAPEGTVTIDGENHHVTKTARIGKVATDGLIHEVRASPQPIEPDPFLHGYPWAAGITGRDMHLTPKDEDRLLLFLAAELARKRARRGPGADLRRSPSLDRRRGGRGGPRRRLRRRCRRTRGPGTDRRRRTARGPDSAGLGSGRGILRRRPELVTVHDAISPGHRPAAELAVVPGEILHR